MKALMATAAAAALLAGVAAANAQSSPSTMNKPQTMEQSTGAATSGERMTTRAKSKRVAHLKKKRSARYIGSETTGSSRVGTVGGPRNDPSIHQSIGRDSRGTPKNQKQQ
jgi:osmotically-inducible protein OsmY